MSFVNPAGLWLLLGIPVLILIYLIRSQHEDRPVSSTFIWKLSSRFMKKRLPVQRIKKILTFLLQLILIIAVSLLAARPIIYDGKICDYIAVIDASASMQTVDETGTSRFSYALKEVEKLSKKTDYGHSISVIVAGDTASWLIKEATSEEDVSLALKDAVCTLGSCDMSQVAELVQPFCAESANPQILFYTDNTYESTENIQVIDLNKQEWNVSVSNLKEEIVPLGLSFTAELTSYNKSAVVTVGLRIDDILTDIQKIRCAANAVTTVTCNAEEVGTYETVEIFVEVQDGFPADNSIAICPDRQLTRNVTLVSKSPLYLQSALKALGNCKVTVSKTPQGAKLTGQDLYIFDGIAPEVYPTDGSVLIFGTQLLPDGLSCAETEYTEAVLRADPDLNSPLYNGLSLGETVVSIYTPLRGNLAWQEAFFCGEHPVIATRSISSTRKIAVVSFDLHDTNLPMQINFPVLMRNLVSFCVPPFVDGTDFAAGKPVMLTVMPNTRDLYVEYPDGQVSTLSTKFETVAVPTNQAGIYTAAITTADGGQYAEFFVHPPAEESRKNVYPPLLLELQALEGTEPEDALIEIWFWVALGLLLLILTEWGWYYHEQA